MPRQGAGSHRSSDEPQSYAPSTSWDSEAPHTAEERTARMLRTYDPTKETVAEYAERLDKQLEGLAALGMEALIATSTIDKLKDGAEVTFDMRSKTHTTKEEISYLKKQLSSILSDVEDGFAPAEALRITTLRSMLSARGADGPAIEQRYRRGEVPTPSPPRRTETPPPRGKTEYHNVFTPDPPLKKTGHQNLGTPPGTPRDPAPESSAGDSLAEKWKFRKNQQLSIYTNTRLWRETANS